jgi:uncharacterized protein YbcI
MIKSGQILLDEPINTLLKSANRKFTVNKPSKDLQAELNKIFGTDVIDTATGLSLQTQEYQKVIDLLMRHQCYDFLAENPSLEEMFAEYYL